jgi:anti-sigma regulatory factor (Ser/Thr protein kinase)
MRANPPRSMRATARSSPRRPNPTTRPALTETWLPAEPSSVAQARSLVSDAALEAGLEGEAAWDLVLATSEAVANAVTHGEAWPNGCILFVTEPRQRGLRVEVTDCGNFDSSLAPAPLDSIGGRGIHLIAAVVDRMEVRNSDDRTVVAFERHAADSNGHVAA